MYVQKSVNNVETYVKDKIRECWKITNTEMNPLPFEYEPTEDVKTKIDLELASYHQ